MPLISVIIPVYNSENYLKKCLDSVLVQTLKDIEIIIVYDESKDNSYDILEEYKKKDSRINLILGDGCCLSSARNIGISVTKGKYISFIDSDDWVEPNFLETMYNIVEDGVDLVVCNYSKIYENKLEENRLILGNEILDIRKIGLESYFLNYVFSYTHGHEVWNKLYKSKIIKENNIRFEPHDDVLAEDLMFNLYYICHVSSIRTINKDFYKYVQHPNTLMSNNKPKSLNRYMNLIDKFILYAKKCNCYKDIEEVLPILLYQLLSNGLFHEYSISKKVSTMKTGLRDASRYYFFKQFTKSLGFGNLVSILREKTNGTKRSEIRARLFSLYCYFGLYGFAASQKFRRYENIK